MQLSFIRSEREQPCIISYIKASLMLQYACMQCMLWANWLNDYSYSRVAELLLLPGKAQYELGGDYGYNYNAE